jgi:TetR/AcrR family transcriptional regulator, cholesterol catabolism regulator
LKRRTQTSRRRDKASAKSSASYHEKRREIARVAAGLFNKHGYRATSLTAIAKILGMDRAALYYYIADKRELFDEVVREVATAHVVMAEEILGQPTGVVDKLDRLMVGLMTSYATSYPLLYLHMRENLSHVEPTRTTWSQYMRSLNRRYEDVFIQLLQTGIAEGTIRPLGSPRIMAYGIIGMIGWTNRWFVPERSPSTGEAIGKTFSAMILGGIVERS